MILGVGGMGTKIASLIRKETLSPLISNAVYVFADTDKNNLNNCCNPTDIAVDINKVSFLRINEKDCNPFVKGLFVGVNILIVIAGLGGKTGTDYVEKAVFTAQNVGVQDIRLFLTTPWLFEGNDKIDKALSTLENLKEFNLEIFNNESLTSAESDSQDVDFYSKLNTIDKIVVSKIEDSINNISMTNNSTVE